MSLTGAGSSASLQITNTDINVNRFTKTDICIKTFVWSMAGGGIWDYISK